MDNELQPREVVSITSRIIDFCSEIECSRETLIAALRLAASAVEEANKAQFEAVARATFMRGIK